MLEKFRSGRSFPNLFPFLRRRASSVASGSTTGFGFAQGNTITAVSSWGTWLQSQPAPIFKPGHRLPLLSIYFYGSDQEYEISLDMADRWGYALNIGYANLANVIPDSMSASPTTRQGRLLKLAVANPTKYKVAGAVAQKFPDATIVPAGHLHDSNGAIVGGWSPEAPPAAMIAAIDYKMQLLRDLVATGAIVATVYDGGEDGIGVPGENPDAKYGVDPTVVAAKGSKSWVDYISERQGVQMRQVYDAVKIACPNRQVYVYYPCTANPYANIPGAEKSTWKYAEVFNINDVPSASVYYKDFFASGAGMGNPTIKDRGYYDQLTHFIAGVAEQIVAYGQPLSYNFVSAGYRHTEGAGIESPWFLPIASYIGFLKCMYALGNKGSVAGYFSSDSIFGGINYPAYDPNNPPHWLLQQQALGEVHARFSWFDAYLFDGDLLPGPLQHIFKQYLPGFEFPCYFQVGNFYRRDDTIRAFVRKLRSSNNWLIVLWVTERNDGSNGADTLVWVNDIPGVEPIQLLARAKGSIYTIDRTGSAIVITQQDL